METVSIVVPAYNCEKVLKKSIQSLLNQSYEEIEIIIINDGSKDNTEAVCKELSESDSRVKTATIENLGVSNARNTALKMATGEYIAFMDSDDNVNIDFIKNMVSALSDDVDLVCGGYNVISSEGKVSFSRFPERLKKDKAHYNEAIEMLQNYACFNTLWNKLFRKSIIQENNIQMDINISMGEDLLFVIDYLSHCENDFVTLNTADYNYYLSSTGLQANFKDGLELRLSQAAYLEKLYNQNNYNKNGLYLEILRCFYTSILEAKGKGQVTEKVLKTPEFKKLCNQKIQCPKKFKMFLLILKTKNKTIIGLMVKLFSLLLSIKGQSYKW